MIEIVTNVNALRPGQIIGAAADGRIVAFSDAQARPSAADVAAAQSDMLDALAERSAARSAHDIATAERKFMATAKRYHALRALA
jgi:hypothetical protein